MLQTVAITGENRRDSRVFRTVRSCVDLRRTYLRRDDDEYFARARARAVFVSSRCAVRTLRRAGRRRPRCAHSAATYGTRGGGDRTSIAAFRCSYGAKPKRERLWDYDDSCCDGQHTAQDRLFRGGGVAAFEIREPALIDRFLLIPSMRARNASLARGQSRRRETDARVFGLLYLRLSICLPITRLSLDRSVCLGIVTLRRDIFPESNIAAMSLARFGIDTKIDCHRLSVRENAQHALLRSIALRYCLIWIVIS